MNRLSINNRRGRSMNRRSRNRRNRSRSVMQSTPQEVVVYDSNAFALQEVSAPVPIIEEVSETESRALCVLPAIEAPQTTFKPVFQCQLAHGSPTGFIEGVNNIGELYNAIASCFPEINSSDILFCTLNSHVVNMDNLISSNLPVNKFIFAHVKGQKKEVRMVKTKAHLGLTITDNGKGKSFIKRILDGSVGSNAQPAMEIGDHISAINGVSMDGLRHYEVARVLRDVPVGHEFIIRLVSPLKSGFSFIAPRSGKNIARPSTNSDLGSGNQTLRFKANGTAVLQEAPSSEIVDLMNAVFEQYLGLNDDDLALTVWEIGSTCTGFADMENKIRESPIGVFQFPDELIFDLFGICGDYKKKLEALENKIVELPKSAENTF